MYGTAVQKHSIRNSLCCSTFGFSSAVYKSLVHFYFHVWAHINCVILRKPVKSIACVLVRDARECLHPLQTLGVLFTSKRNWQNENYQTAVASVCNLCTGLWRKPWCDVSSASELSAESTTSKTAAKLKAIERWGPPEPRLVANSPLPRLPEHCSDISVCWVNLSCQDEWIKIY